MNRDQISDACRTAQPSGALCALVAVKSRALCKSRLAGALAPAARLTLVRCMLAHVLEAAREAPSITRVLLVSPERDVVPDDTAVLHDAGESLNHALTQAHARLAALGFTAALVLPADLPRVTGAELEQLVHAGRETGFAIAPDQAQRGTNALYLPLGTAFRFSFGHDSLRLHLIEAERLGMRARVVQLPGLAFDVDAPQDLARLQATHTQRRAEAACG